MFHKTSFFDEECRIFSYYFISAKCSSGHDEFKYVYHLSCLPPKLENLISTTKLQPGITRCIQACASSLLPSLLKIRKTK